MRRSLFVFLFWFLSCGDTPAPVEEDAGTDSGQGCARDEECDDGRYCNGAEQCEAGACEAGTPPCAEDASCTEDTESCESGCQDGDGDGRLPITCGGDDCDDDDPNRFPGNAEVCDAVDHDEDCDDSTFGFRDTDRDTFPDASCCNGESCGSDCDDMQPAVHPSEAESCDGLDNDCDGMVDETVQRTFYMDSDRDTFGAAGGASMVACDPPTGFVENDADCDDGNASIHPLAAEICDATCVEDGSGCIDENCDGVTLQPMQCECTGSGSVTCPGARGACAAGTATCNPTTGMLSACSIQPQMETCNMIDDDCDGVVDNGAQVACYADLDDDGYAPTGAQSEMQCRAPGRDAVGGCPFRWTDRAPTGPDVDCDDDDDGTHPGASELCDLLDNDCSSGGGAEPAEDMDGDNFASITASCVGGPLPKTDCRDSRADTYVGALEVCDRRDNDCSSGGGVEAAEDADNDGHTSSLYSGCMGGTLPRDDCNDGRATAFPGQTLSFTDPMCGAVAGTFNPCSCADGSRGCGVAGMQGCVCGMALESAHTSQEYVRLWDYNCSSTLQTVPSPTSCRCGEACPSAPVACR